MKTTRTQKGHCFTEMIVGGIVMIPVMLFGLDAITLGLGVSINDHLAKEAARVAAVQTDSHSAKKAADNVVNRLKKSTIITEASVTTDGFTYTDKDRVTVKTELYIKVPAPFPFFDGARIYARAVEPIVANPSEYKQQII